MYFSKLLMKEFGKFNNEEIDLESGINLIYGKPESGKSTIKDFIVSMLYGTEQNVKSKDKDIYSIRKPKEAHGYSGKAYINKGNKKYLAERVFSKNGGTVSLLDVSKGKDVRLNNYQMLQGTLMDMDKDVFSTRLCVDESPIGTGSFADNITDYMNRVLTTGSTELNSVKAVKVLKKKKSQIDISTITHNRDMLIKEIDTYSSLDSDIANVRGRISENDEEFGIETARRKREARVLADDQNGYEEQEGLSEKLDRLAEKSAFDGVSSEDEPVTEGRMDTFNAKFNALSKKVWFIILSGVFVVGVITLIVNMLPFEKAIRQLFIVCTSLLVIITIVDGMYNNGYFTDSEEATPTEEEFKKIIEELEDTSDDVDIDMSFAKEFLDKKSVLREEECALLEKREYCNDLKEQLELTMEQLHSLEQERDAIELAINSINRISMEILSENGFIINGNIADIVEQISGGKYTDVMINDLFEIKVCTKGQYINIEKLDRNDLKLVFLAIRISIARSSVTERMPVVIDDIFEDWEPKIVQSMFNVLKTIDTDQIIVTTSNPYIEQVLVDVGFSHKYLTIG